MKVNFVKFLTIEFPYLSHFSINFEKTEFETIVYRVFIYLYFITVETYVYTFKNVL